MNDLYSERNKVSYFQQNHHHQQQRKSATDHHLLLGVVSPSSTQQSSSTTTSLSSYQASTTGTYNDFCAHAELQQQQQRHHYRQEQSMYNLTPVAQTDGGVRSHPVSTNYPSHHRQRFETSFFDGPIPHEKLPGGRSSPLSHSSSVGSLLDWDISLMGISPIPFHPKPVLHIPPEQPVATDDDWKNTSPTAQQQSSCSTIDYFIDDTPLPLNSASIYDFNMISFPTSNVNINSHLTTGCLPSFVTPQITSEISSPPIHLPVITTSQVSKRIPSTDGSAVQKKQRCNVTTSSVPDNEITQLTANNALYSNKLAMRSRNKNRLKREKQKCADVAASLLHHTCKLFSQALSIVESAVQFDPDAIHTAVPTLCSADLKPVSMPNNNDPNNQHSLTQSAFTIRNMYSYPLNIALQYDASMDVIIFLLNLYPDVLTKEDGPNQTGSLSIALSSMNEVEQNGAVSISNQDTTKDNTITGTGGFSQMDQLVQMFVMANPEAVKVVDRSKNNVLHYMAKRRGNDISCATITMVYELYPEALHAVNCLGQTPMQMAQRNMTITDTILDHWYHFSYRESETKLEKNLIQIDHELDLCDATRPTH